MKGETKIWLFYCAGFPARIAAKSETASVTAWTAVSEWFLSSSISFAMIGLAWSANPFPIKNSNLFYKT